MVPTLFHKSKHLFVFLSLLALLLNSAGSPGHWQLRNGKIIPFDLQETSGTQVVEKPKLAGDLDGDGDRECLSLSGESAQITDCSSATLWESPEGWRVSEAQIADVTHDGKNDVVLLVWRPFRPWPADRFMPYGGRIANHQNQEGQSCQLILIGWQKGEYREIWAGSALANPISNVLVADLDGDGLLELAALESDYDTYQKGGQLTIWRWIGFGFSLLDRSEGRWERLAIMGDGVHHWLFTR